MQVTGELRKCPAGHSLCRKCFQNNCCKKVIISCRCAFAIHKECLIEEIKSKPQLVSPIQTRPGYNEYRCGTCNQSVLYRPDFSEACIPCSSYTAHEICSVWICNSIMYLIFLGAIGFFIYLAIDYPSLIGLYAALIVLFLLAGISFIWANYNALQATFYVGNQQETQ